MLWRFIIDDTFFSSDVRKLSALEESILLVEKLGKDFRRHCRVKSISFHVKRGECFGLLGMNGAGKTTTFELLAGITQSTRGKVYKVNNFIQFLDCMHSVRFILKIICQFTFRRGVKNQYKFLVNMDRQTLHFRGRIMSVEVKSNI